MNKGYFEKEALKCGLDFDQIDRAWEKWKNKAQSGKDKISNPLEWLINCARKKYRFPEEIYKENRAWIRDFKRMAEMFGKSDLIHANDKDGYLFFTDNPNVTYYITDRDFYNRVEKQMFLRAMSV